mmetsp:Transcript_63303/g.196015  ORF Transcript_63303/g.196015 Transcript_63303/m.196015 type:complete len:474 (-) Transcript_63303:32-1453(-)
MRAAPRRVAAVGTAPPPGPRTPRCQGRGGTQEDLRREGVHRHLQGLHRHWDPLRAPGGVKRRGARRHSAGGCQRHRLHPRHSAIGGVPPGPAAVVPRTGAGSLRQGGLRDGRRPDCGLAGLFRLLLQHLCCERCTVRLPGAWCSPAADAGALRRRRARDGAVWLDSPHRGHEDGERAGRRHHPAGGVLRLGERALGRRPPRGRPERGTVEPWAYPMLCGHGDLHLRRHRPRDTDPREHEGAGSLPPRDLRHAVLLRAAAFGLRLGRLLGMGPADRRHRPERAGGRWGYPGAAVVRAGGPVHVPHRHLPDVLDLRGGVVPRHAGRPEAQGAEELLPHGGDGAHRRGWVLRGAGPLHLRLHSGQPLQRPARAHIPCHAASQDSGHAQELGLLAVGPGHLPHPRHSIRRHHALGFVRGKPSLLMQGNVPSATGSVLVFAVHRPVPHRASLFIFVRQRHEADRGHTGSSHEGRRVSA